MKCWTLAWAWAAGGVLVAADVDVGALKWHMGKYGTREGSELKIKVAEGDLPKKGRLCAIASAAIDLAPHMGKSLLFKVRASATGVSRQGAPQGFKFQLSYRDEASGAMRYPEIHDAGGTFTNREFMFCADFSNAKATRGWLNLGLQNAIGAAAYDLSTLTISERPGAFPPVTNRTYRQVYTDRVKALPRLRGVMLPSHKIEEKDFADLKAWGATLARYQMTSGPKGEKRHDLAAYDAWLEGQLDRLDRDVLPWGRKYGIRIVVDLHNGPGQRMEEPRGESAMCHDRRFADHFVASWEKIARRFKVNEDVIYGYDLINEPQQTLPPGAADYFTIQRLAAEAIRRIDPVTPIIVESNMMDAPHQFANLPALELPDVIYQVHMYVPGGYTHQGVSNRNRHGPRPIYPDGGCNRDYLAQNLKAVRDFQLAHGAKIYVGEFSAVCYADGAAQYIADCISIFEEYGWDWTYHAFREWSGWSVEHLNMTKIANRFTYAPDNPRKDVLVAGLRGEPLGPVTPREAGFVWIKDDWKLLVRDATNEVELVVSRPDLVKVTAEPMKPKTKDVKAYPWTRQAQNGNPLYWGWTAGTRLKQIVAFECAVHGALVPGSLVVKKADGTVLEEGKDFESERTWGAVARLEGGRIGPDETVYADYVYGQQRIDRIVKAADGTFSLRQGTPMAANPVPPAPAAGETPVATVYVDAQTERLTDANVFPVYETAFPAALCADVGSAEKLLPRTLAKLRNGEKVKILAWGDSVTNGGYLPEGDRWQGQFLRRLRERFPKAEIELASCGWGGRNSAAFRSVKMAPPGHPYNYREKVLGARADLCVMEFVNDCGMGREAVMKAYGEILADFKAQGTELCILTPHYTRPDWMGLPSQKYCDRDPRPYVWHVREFCRANGVACADASLRWGRLWRQGVPYKTLLVNDINHPNAQGMSYFADALMALFP